MSKPKSKGTRGGSGGKDKPKGGAGRSGKEREALRGLFLGMLTIALIAGFFFVPISGKTTFSHLLHALGLQGGGEAATKAAEKKPQGRLAPARELDAPSAVRAVTARPERAAPQPREADRSVALAGTAERSRPARPGGVSVAANVCRRPPLEKATAADDAALDALVRRHARD